MGHYLSDLLPDPSVVCLNCREGVWEEKTIQAWDGYLKTCNCSHPDPCPAKEAIVTGEPGNYIWVRKETTVAELNIGAWMQRWEESERGWGVRPDGVFYFPTKEAAVARTAVQLSEMRAREKDIYHGATPDEYSRPCGDPEFVPVSKELAEEIQKSKGEGVFRLRPEVV